MLLCLQKICFLYSWGPKLLNTTSSHQVPYSGKVWQWESLVNLANCPWFTKLKPSKLVLTINNLLANQLIRQTFFCQMLEKSQFTKLSLCQTSRYIVDNFRNTQTLLSQWPNTKENVVYITAVKANKTAFSKLQSILIQT